jgi:cyclic pyranopterin phosphate synthase
MTDGHNHGDVPPLLDGQGRPINSVRISINRECNLSCFYCHNEGMLSGKRSMTVDEIVRIAKISSQLGIRKVKLTGGEPLEREDVVEIVTRVSPFFEDVSMTTNAIGLAPLAMDLKNAGLDRVNISLHSLDPVHYSRISGHDQLTDAMAGIDAAIEVGLYPVKLNMVLLRGINEGDIPDMLLYAAGKGAVLQVIEMEMERERTSSRIFSEYHMGLQGIREWLMSTGRKNGANPLHNRERFIVDRLPDGTQLPSPVEVELVMPMHNACFCDNCTRIRITAGGYVKGCLFDRDCVEDLVTPLQEGAEEEVLKDLILRVLAERRPYWTELPCDAGIMRLEG